MGDDALFTKADGCSLEVRHLFDLYLHNDLDRRAFLERVAPFVCEGHSAAGLLEELRMRFAENH